MARPQAPSSSTSASSVTLLAQGMRPLTVTVPRLRRSSASVDNMAVTARANMAGGVHGAAAHGAVGTAALHQILRALGEGLCLLARDAHARGGRLLGVAHAHGGHDPRGLGKGQQVHLGGHRALGCAQLGDEAAEILAQRAHLLLLALERDELALLACLQKEDSLARLADGADGEEIGLLELEGLAHLRSEEHTSELQSQSNLVCR